ncbi:unnamed protein product [Arctia plantaginis]|uniref:Uncharacterized protein n=1 Tax=Arctia plantaginis TaxID=874455 RepID=A0A8S0ZC27_ARCPL|nr:unnamed protein product [Arctia plantaginis]
MWVVNTFPHPPPAMVIRLPLRDKRHGYIVVTCGCVRWGWRGGSRGSGARAALMPQRRRRMPPTAPPPLCAHATDRTLG